MSTCSQLWKTIFSAQGLQAITISGPLNTPKVLKISKKNPRNFLVSRIELKDTSPFAVLYLNNSRHCVLEYWEPKQGRVLSSLTYKDTTYDAYVTSTDATFVQSAIQKTDNAKKDRFVPGRVWRLEQRNLPLSFAKSISMSDFTITAYGTEQDEFDTLVALAAGWDSISEKMLKQVSFDIKPNTADENPFATNFPFKVDTKFELMQSAVARDLAMLTVGSDYLVVIKRDTKVHVYTNVTNEQIKLPCTFTLFSNEDARKATLKQQFNTSSFGPKAAKAAQKRQNQEQNQAVLKQSVTTLVKQTQTLVSNISTFVFKEDDQGQRDDIASQISARGTVKVVTTAACIKAAKQQLEPIQEYSAKLISAIQAELAKTNGDFKSLATAREELRLLADSLKVLDTTLQSVNTMPAPLVLSDVCDQTVTKLRDAVTQVGAQAVSALNATEPITLELNTVDASTVGVAMKQYELWKSVNTGGDTDRLAERFLQLQQAEDVSAELKRIQAEHSQLTAENTTLGNKLVDSATADVKKLLDGRTSELQAQLAKLHASNESFAKAVESFGYTFSPRHQKYCLNDDVTTCDTLSNLVEKLAQSQLVKDGTEIGVFLASDDRQRALARMVKIVAKSFGGSEQTFDTTLQNIEQLLTVAATASSDTLPQIVQLAKQLGYTINDAVILDQSNKVVLPQELAQSIKRLVDAMPNTEELAAWSEGAQSINALQRKLQLFGYDQIQKTDHVTMIKTFEKIREGLTTLKKADAFDPNALSYTPKLLQSSADFKQFESDIITLGQELNRLPPNTQTRGAELVRLQKELNVNSAEEVIAVLKAAPTTQSIEDGRLALEQLQKLGYNPQKHKETITKASQTLATLKQLETENLVPLASNTCTQLEQVVGKNVCADSNKAAAAAETIRVAALELGDIDVPRVAEQLRSVNALTKTTFKLDDADLKPKLMRISEASSAVADVSENLTKLPDFTRAIKAAGLTFDGATGNLVDVGTRRPVAPDGIADRFNLMHAAASVDENMTLKRAESLNKRLNGRLAELEESQLAQIGKREQPFGLADLTLQTSVDHDAEVQACRTKVLNDPKLRKQLNETAEKHGEKAYTRELNTFVSECRKLYRR